MDEIEAMAVEWRRAAERVRRRAGLVRAAADLTWEGPGAQAYRDEVAARWAGLVALATAMERAADSFMALVALRGAA